jgi:hypothetical protein
MEAAEGVEAVSPRKHPARWKGFPEARTISLGSNAGLLTLRDSLVSRNTSRRTRSVISNTFGGILGRVSGLASDEAEEARALQMAEYALRRMLAEVVAARQGGLADVSRWVDKDRWRAVVKGKRKP